MSAHARLLAGRSGVTDPGYNLRPPKSECEICALDKAGLDNSEF